MQQRQDHLPFDVNNGKEVIECLIVTRRHRQRV